MIDRYATDGVVLVTGLFAEHLGLIEEAIEQDLANPGPYATSWKCTARGIVADFLMIIADWQQIDALQKLIFTSDVGQVAAQLMQSDTAQLFHDHILVKEAGTSSATPWHQDSPYYFVEGMQTISFWTVVEPVTDATLRCVPWLSSMAKACHAETLAV